VHPLELFYLQQPGGVELQLYDNGAAVDKISTDGTLGPRVLSVSGDRRLHRSSWRRCNAPVRLFGWSERIEA
jgi:hypothetical protein